MFYFLILIINSIFYVINISFSGRPSSSNCCKCETSGPDVTKTYVTAIDLLFRQKMQSSCQSS